MQRDKDRDNRGGRYERGSQARGDDRGDDRRSLGDFGGRQQDYRRQDPETRGLYQGREQDRDRDYAYERDRERFPGERAPGDYYTGSISGGGKQRGRRDESSWPGRESYERYEGGGADWSGYGPGYGASGGYGPAGGGSGEYGGYGSGGPGYGSYGANERYGGSSSGDWYGSEGWRGGQRAYEGQRDSRRGSGSYGREYAQDQGRRGHFDPEYHQWRSEQIRALDEAYWNYRQERYRKFAEEFEQWRRNRRQQQPQDESGSQVSGGSDSPAERTEATKSGK